jgi:hypothetical protein
MGDISDEGQLIRFGWVVWDFDFTLYFELGEFIRTVRWMNYLSPITNPSISPPHRNS